MTDFNKLFTDDDCAFLAGLDDRLQAATAPTHERSIRIPDWAIKALGGCAGMFGGYFPLTGESTDPSDKI